MKQDKTPAGPESTELDRRKRISIQSKMLAIIFHDMAPVLTYICDSTRRLQEQPRLDNAALQEELENLSFTAEELISNIRIFLAWGDFPQPSFESLPAYHSLFLLVESVTGVYRGEARKKGLGILNKTDREQLIRIDPVLLRIVLSNLVANSLKHTDSGVISISSAVESQRIVIRIEDTGRGMMEERVAALSAVLQAKGQKERYKSGGLGYQIIADLMSMADGEVSLQSTPGSGTVIQLYFGG